MSGHRGELSVDAVALRRLTLQKAVMVLDNELYEDDIESLKFLCQGLIINGKLENVDSLHEVASLLKKASLLHENDYFLLADMLQYVQRIDVLEHIGYKQNEVLVTRQQRGSAIEPLYVLLFQLAEELAMEDVKKATFLYGKVPKSKKVSSGLDLFTLMLRHQSISPEKMDPLTEIFESIERQDLIERVKRYEETDGQSVLGDLESRFDAAEAASSAAASSASARMTEMTGQVIAKRAVSESRSYFQGAQGNREGAVPSPLRFYSMKSDPRGYCVIINNRNFYRDPANRDPKHLFDRDGTDVDRDKLRDTFTHLHFSVRCYDNLTDLRMIRLMQNFASQDHTRLDCFVCCILTHGVQGALYGVNGVTVPVRDLTSPFRSQACPGLAGKPKLFFMQACQGREEQPVNIQTDGEEIDSPSELIPNESDYLLGYATAPGFVSYRSKTLGSWYVTRLTELLVKHARDHDILDILTLVNFEVGQGDASIEGVRFKQSPAPMYTLRKKLIFSRP